MGRLNYEALSARYHRLENDDGVHCVVCGLDKLQDFHYPTGNRLDTVPPEDAHAFSTCKVCFGALTGHLRKTGVRSVHELILWGKGRTRRGHLTYANKVVLSKKKYAMRWNLGKLGKIMHEGKVVGICDPDTMDSYDFDLWRVYVSHREELVALEGEELRARCEELFPDHRFVDLIISCYNS